jgi:hypothetical protein
MTEHKTIKLFIGDIPKNSGYEKHSNTELAYQEGQQSILSQCKDIPEDWRPDDWESIRHEICECNGDCFEDCQHYGAIEKFATAILKALGEKK